MVKVSTADPGFGGAVDAARDDFVLERAEDNEAEFNCGSVREGSGRC